MGFDPPMNMPPDRDHDPASEAGRRETAVKHGRAICSEALRHLEAAVTELGKLQQQGMVTAIVSDLNRQGRWLLFMAGRGPNPITDGLTYVGGPLDGQDLFCAYRGFHCHKVGPANWAAYRHCRDGAVFLGYATSEKKAKDMVWQDKATNPGRLARD